MSWNIVKAISILILSIGLLFIVIIDVRDPHTKIAVKILVTITAGTWALINIVLMIWYIIQIW